MAVVPKRFNRFSLTMPPEKPGLMAFKRPPSREPPAPGTGTFDFLGLTPYWAKTRRGYWVIKRKTGRKRLRRVMKEIGLWCRENRHTPRKEPYRIVGSKRRGYDQYDGIRGHFRMREAVVRHTLQAWRYWLSRRRHKGRINWQKLVALVHDKRPLPTPRIIHRLSQRQGQQSDAPNGEEPVWFAMGESWWLPRNRMRETFTSGSVGRAPGNRCLYPDHPLPALNPENAPGVSSCPSPAAAARSQRQRLPQHAAGDRESARGQAGQGFGGLGRQIRRA
jgi:hypothetical protein